MVDDMRNEMCEERECTLLELADMIRQEQGEFLIYIRFEEEEYDADRRGV